MNTVTITKKEYNALVFARKAAVKKLQKLLGALVVGLGWLMWKNFWQSLKLPL